MSANSLTSNACLVSNCRLSYANIYKTAPDLNGRLVYSVVLLIPKTSDVSGIKQAITEAVKQGIEKKWKGFQPPNLNLPLKDGDAYAAAKPGKRDAYVGNWFINCKQDPEMGQPVLLDENRVRSINPQDIQSGDWANAVVEFIPYDTKGSQGVTTVPKVIQKTATGERFTGGLSVEAALAAIGGEANAPAPAAAAGGINSLW
jgi:hypothetical protein